MSYVLRGLGKNYYLLQAMLRKYGVGGSARILWEDALYDVRKGTDTFMPIHQEQLFDDVKQETYKKYAPSPFSLIRESLRKVEDDIDFTSSNFVDYGSGKGKVLIGAAEFPFQRLKGVEFSELLHDIAGRNMKKLGLEERVDLLNIDASTFMPAREDRVFYFFNPFMGEVLENCLKNIVDTHEAGNRRVLLYANPASDETFKKYFTKTVEYSIKPGDIRVYRYEENT